jgi:hypothetical protein
VVKVYVGCALTNAPEEFRHNVEVLKYRLKVPGVKVLEFMGLTNGSARDVYIHDIINCVSECDLMLAICDLPSTGLGWEMATQVSRHKPLVAFAHKDAKVTRLILDPPVVNYKFHRYNDFDEVYRIAAAASVEVSTSLNNLKKPVSA